MSTLTPKNLATTKTQSEFSFGLCVWLGGVFLLLALASCTAKVVDKNADNRQKATSFGLTRVFQRVIRFDCQNKVLSDQVETVGAPTQLISVEPNTRVNFEDSYFENKTLGTKPSCVVDKTQFQIDYSLGFCNMQVQTGVNEIQYRFYYCPEYKTKPDSHGNPTKYCAAPLEVREEGSFFIDVNYSEVHRDGTMEVHKTPEQCQPPKN